MLSPNLAILITYIEKVQKSKKILTTKLKKVVNILENRTFKLALKKSPAMISTMLQFTKIPKSRMRTCFKGNEKLMALALYKYGPKAYRLLRKLFALPSPLKLSKMLSTASLKPGLNENVFYELKKRVNRMSNITRLCVLLFDQITLRPQFEYMRRNDEICGFVDNGQIKKEEVADRALVFMVIGVKKNFKQPLAYTLCSASTIKTELIHQIKNVVRKLNEIGLKVVATTCNHCSTNVSAINLLIDENREDYLKNGKEFKTKVFKIDDLEIAPLYDVPHLIKDIRNNFLTKDVKVITVGKEKTAKWEHVKMLMKENIIYGGSPFIPKFTENIVEPQKIAKRKVECATQLLSGTVGVHIRFLAVHEVFPKECQDTGEIIILFDRLFDSLNGSIENWEKRKKALLGPVTRNSAHKKLWRESKPILSTMSFVDANNKPTIVPSIKCWLQTIENIEYISDTVSNNFGLHFLWMRHFNLDPLQNFVDCIRSQGYDNKNPTCATFETAFASLFINDLSRLHSLRYKCEMDNCYTLRALKTIFFKNTKTSTGAIEIENEDIFTKQMFGDISNKINNPKAKAQLEFVTRHLLQKLNKRSCVICEECLNSKNESIITVIGFRQNKRYLKYPSDSLVNCVSNLQDVVNKILQKDPRKQNIKRYIKCVFSHVVNYSFLTCDVHRQEIIEKLEDISINLFIYTWCKETNRILTGSRVDYNQESTLQFLAYKYCKKQNKSYKCKESRK